jgi:hypothetical protein
VAAQLPEARLMPTLEDHERDPLNRAPTTVHAQIARAARILRGAVGDKLLVIEAADGEGAAVRYLIDHYTGRTKP